MVYVDVIVCTLVGSAALSEQFLAESRVGDVPSKVAIVRSDGGG